jgi:hypothetical protein
MLKAREIEKMINKLLITSLSLIMVSCVSFTEYSEVRIENERLKRENNTCKSYIIENKNLIIEHRNLIFERNLCEKRLIICSRKKARGQ